MKSLVTALQLHQSFSNIVLDSTSDIKSINAYEIKHKQFVRIEVEQDNGDKSRFRISINDWCHLVESFYKNGTTLLAKGKQIAMQLS